jgi:hypothetical protein
VSRLAASSLAHWATFSSKVMVMFRNRVFITRIQCSTDSVLTEATATRAGARERTTTNARRLNVVIQRKLKWMRTQADGIHFLRTFVVDIRAQQLFREDVAFQQECIVAGEHIESIFE